jgi:hypothetical protein
MTRHRYAPVLGTVLALLALAGCASLPDITTDHDPAADFSRYQTYSWRERPDEASPLMRPRIVAAIDQQLAARGWRQVPDGGDVALAAHVATRTEQSLDTFYDGPFWGGWGWHGGWGFGAGYSRARTRTYTVGTLVVDMFDARTRQAIWRGTAEGTVPKTPAKSVEHLDYAVRKMFETFPPGVVGAASGG